VYTIINLTDVSEKK